MTDSDPRAKWRHLPEDPVTRERLVEERAADPAPGGLVYVERMSLQQQAAMGG